MFLYRDEQYQQQDGTATVLNPLDPGKWQVRDSQREYKIHQQIKGVISVRSRLAVKSINCLVPTKSTKRMWASALNLNIKFKL